MISMLKARLLLHLYVNSAEAFFVEWAYKDCLKYLSTERLLDLY